MRTPGANAQVHVKLSTSSFVPRNITLLIGVNNTVQWTDNDLAAVTHTVTADNGCFDSGNMSPPDTFTLTFVAAGTYKYHCNYHLPNMVGTVVVKG